MSNSNFFTFYICSETMPILQNMRYTDAYLVLLFRHPTSVLYTSISHVIIYYKKVTLEQFRSNLFTFHYLLIFTELCCITWSRMNIFSKLMNAILTGIHLLSLTIHVLNIRPLLPAKLGLPLSRTYYRSFKQHKTSPFIFY